ncbi:MAG: cyclic nucleotide-binding domain-containing protein, partial [Gammaproteobacteria bacterium]|nr:cyclic nucleotide-binding domain-containing protein [Gammaproteobacteria bacterium]
MKNSSTQIDRKILKTLEPLNRLNPILLDELAAKSIIDEVPAGRIVCRYNDKDSRQIYLLSGQLEIATQGQTEVKVVKTKTALTKPVAEGSPRNITVKTKSASTLLYIDADLLELLLSDEPGLNTTYQVTEIESDSDDDWMLTFLQSPAFLQLPTENIQKLLTRMEEIPVKKDQVVIAQGGMDDNYYIIKNGSCNVHRKPFKDAANVLLAVLPTGSGFGEEALITNGKRNATITMREDGALMRLKKKDFLELLITPLISYFEHTEIQNKIQQGNVVIDVRTETQSKQKPLEGAVNIPLSMLRMKFDSLNSGREYILVCNDGSQSAAAAFLMISNGFKCSVLNHGLNSVQAKPAEQTTEVVDNTINNSAAEEAIKQAATAKKQAEHIAAQQKQIKEAREKAEQDIIKRKQELAESRARIADKNQKLTSAQNEALQLKEKAQQELEKAQAESKLIEQRQKETNEAMQRAEEIMKQSELAAIQARKQAEEEAALIKQRAIEEAEYLRAEVFAARQQMEQDSARIKQEEELIKSSALQIKNEADEIRRKAMSEAEQVRLEIEQTRALLSEKLQQTQEEEKRKHDAIVAEAQKRADELAATKTQQAAAEAEAIRQKAKEDAERLHNELEETRKQIEAEAARVISELKEQSKQAATKVIEEETKVEVIAEPAPAPAPVLKNKEETVDYKSVSIPGMSAIEPIEPIDEDAAKIKAEAIKTKLAQAQALRESQEITADSARIKVRQSNDKTILEGDEDLFIFKAPGSDTSR